MPVKPKTILIIAGPNGAGKSTFAREYLPEELGVGNFINADLIAAGLSPFSPERAAFQAGRIMLEEMKRLSANNESFGFETTLSGRTYLKDIENWRRVGYNVILVYLRLRSVRLALNRIKTRVKQGGHDVPAAVVERRFYSGWKNFQNHYKDAVNRWFLYDNTGEKPIVIDQGAKT